MSNTVVSRLRSVTPADHEVLTSKNILTRLEKLSKAGTYSECKKDYERLCEYAHPNLGMNMLHVVASPKSNKLSGFSSSNRKNRLSARCPRRQASWPMRRGERWR